VGKLVGTGRALADGRDCSYLCDIAVLPSRQGSGLGKEIVRGWFACRLATGRSSSIRYRAGRPFTKASAFAA
jgi:hypothetical protein